MKLARMLAVLTLAAWPAAPAHAQSAAPSAAELRRLYFQHDYAGAIVAGAPLLKAPASPQATAWLVASLAADNRPDDARAAAAALAKRHPGDRWTDFAQAMARVSVLGADSEADAHAARARAAAPWAADMVWLQALVLGRHTASAAHAIALLDSAAARKLITPELLSLRGEDETFRWRYSNGQDSTAPRRALAAFDAALKLDSLNVGAWLGKVMLYSVQGSPGAALDAARHARDAAPLALEARGAYWMALRQRRSAPAEANTREMLDDLAQLAEARPNWASTLRAQAELFHELKLEARADSAEAQLRARYPGSDELEELEISRIRDLASALQRQQIPDSVAARAELRRRVEAFVRTPGRHASNLGSAYQTMWDVLRQDSSASPAQLNELAQGLMRYGEPGGRGTVVPLVLLMAERRADPVLAERLARQIPARMKADEAHMGFSSSDTSAAARRRAEQARREDAQATMHDALAWIYFNDNKLAEAERELAAARKLSPRDPTFLYHAGRLAERQGRANEAEKLYRDGYRFSGFSAEDASGRALRALLVRRTGSTQAFDTLASAYRARQRAALKARILAERLRSPRPLPAFKLTRLEGGTFSTDEMKGKVGVVNFWGLWCPPCVAELPQLEKLYARFRDDPDVVIVTIDNDPDPQAVRDFVARRKLQLPVLLDDSLSRREVKGWPTTWFVDRQGRIAYQIDGARYDGGAEMVDVLAWRIEDLKDTTTRATPATKAAPPASQQPADAAAAAKQVRKLFFLQDYAGAAAEGSALLKRFPTSPELAAWTIGARARVGSAEDALAAADSLVRARPSGPWGHFAWALAAQTQYARSADALPHARRARAAAPGSADAWWLYGEAMTRNEQAPRALAVVDSAVQRVGRTAPLLMVRGMAILDGAFTEDGPDTLKLGRARAAFDEAIALDSTYVAALLRRGDEYDRAGDAAGGLRMYRRALAATPGALGVHEAYWSEVEGFRDWSEQQKQDTVVADAERVLRAHPDDPATLRAVAGAWHDLKLTARRDSLEGELLARFPDSDAAEGVLLDRIGRLSQAVFRKEVADTAAANAEQRRLLREFIARPVHHSRARLLGAYRDLGFFIEKDTTVSAAELETVARHMGQDRLNPHIANVQVPIALADRRVALPLAEQLATTAPARMVQYFQRMRSYYRPENYAKYVKFMEADGHDALGWVYFVEGKRTAAERELTRALALNPNAAGALYHMGCLEEARGLTAAAEKLYARAYAAERRLPVHPGEDALKRLYQARTGSLTGYETFIGQLQEKAREERRARVLEERLKTPKPMPAFSLARLEGGTFSSEQLKGRIGVVNFWGTWCGPCIMELPQIQKLYEKYRNDPDVVFLTIDNDGDLAKVREFMARRKFDFPVLVDDGFVARAGVTAWPTTWIVDRQGRIVFRPMGGSESDTLFEDYVWRIESLKPPKAGDQASPTP